jgi:hypothetical protein
VAEREQNDEGLPGLGSEDGLLGGDTERADGPGPLPARKRWTAVVYSSSMAANYRGIKVGKVYEVDVGGMGTTPMRVLSIKGDRVEVEYVESWPGRTETVPLELFPDMTGGDE